MLLLHFSHKKMPTTMAMPSRVPPRIRVVLLWIVFTLACFPRGVAFLSRGQGRSACPSESFAASLLHRPTRDRPDDIADEPLMCIPSQLHPVMSVGRRTTKLRYKNHRELQIDLDLSHRQLSKDDYSSPRLAALLGRLLHWWLQVRIILSQLRRSLFKRYTIYVLQCQDGKYYVGSTVQLRQRWQQHATGQGAAWTRLYPPLRMVFTYRRVPMQYYLGMESKITAEWMLKHGVNNVRGASFAETREYTLFHCNSISPVHPTTQADVDRLTGFLGHYMDLSYHQVESVLRQSLPEAGDIHSTPPKRRRKLRRKRRLELDKCYYCGEHGHWVKDCPKLSQLREVTTDL